MSDITQSRDNIIDKLRTLELQHAAGNTELGPFIAAIRGTVYEEFESLDNEYGGVEPEDPLDDAETPEDSDDDDDIDPAHLAS
jgi:hypothetical protein